MSNIKSLYSKLASASQQKNVESSKIDQIFSDGDVVLKEGLPTKEQYLNTDSGNRPYTTTMNVRVINGDSRYRWQDAKPSTIERAQESEYSLDLRTKELPKPNTTKNTSQGFNPDWPGMNGLNAPTAADNNFLATGNGGGSIIVSRNQIKTSSEQTPTYSTGRPIKGFGDIGKNLRNLAANVGTSLGSILPPRLTYDVAKGGTNKGVAFGALSHGLLGALLGAAYNKFKRNKYVKYKDPVTGEEYDTAEEDDTTPMWKDMLVGGGIGAGIGGIIGHRAAYEQAEPNKPFGEGYYPFGELNTKKGSVINGSDILSTLDNKLMMDYSLSFAQRNALINYLHGLPMYVIQSEFGNLLSTGVGAGIGALIAKKLLGLGMGGTIIASILGGMIGSNATSPNNQESPFTRSAFAPTGMFGM